MGVIIETPEFLILDEPMNGSHNEEDVKVLCDKVIEMDKGKII